MNDYSISSLQRYLLTNAWEVLSFLRLDGVSITNRSILVRVVPLLSLAGVLLCLVLSLFATPTQAAGITVSKTASSGMVKAGQPFTYTIHVLNTTGNNINLNITDTVPSGATVVNLGGGMLANGILSWGIPVTDGSTVDVSFAVVVNQAGQVVNANYGASSGSNSSNGDPLVTTIIPDDPAIVTINTNPTPVTVGESAQLVIMVTDIYGNPVADGTNVTINFDKGIIDGQPAGVSINATTSGGQVVKTLVGGTAAGTAHITALAGSAQNGVNVIFEPGPPSSLTVLALPSSIPANGNTTATITAVVQDSYGNLVNPTSVNIATSLGKLNGGGTTATMDTNNGQVSASLGDTIAGTARITVSVGSLVDASQSVYLVPGPPTHLLLQANPSAIAADKSSTSDITLLVLDQNNNRVDTAVPVTITTSLGTLTGGGTIYTETTTDGEVQTQLTSGTQAGTANISATALGLNTSTSVNFVPGPPASISLDVNPAAIPGDGVSMTVLAATVHDAFGNAVNTPVGVTFATASGIFLPDSAGTTVNGVITRSLRSSTVLGTVPVTATAVGLSTPAIGSVDFVVGPPTTVAVSLNPTSPITVGVPVALTLTVRDSAGHPVPGVAITATSALGSLIPSSTGTTDGAGQLQRTLVSTRAGSDILGVFSAQGVLNVSGDSILFVPDAPAQAVLTVSPNQLFADGTTTAVVTATVKDQYGNATSGMVPNFTTSLGTLIGSSATNASGVATRTLQSSTTLGTSVVSISGLLTVTQATVNFVVGAPAVAILQAQPTQATANGTDLVTLVITVTDSVGHPIVGQTLAVTSTFGTVTGSGATNAQGALIRTLSSTKSGQPQIYVAGIPASGDSPAFLPGPLYYVTVSPFGSSGNPVPAFAGVPLTFNAAGYDANNNLITGLSFVWVKAGQGGDGVINASGVFTGTIVGKVQVKATVSGKTGASFVYVNPGAAATAAIDASPTTVLADGVNAASLTFTVRDIYGNKVRVGIPLTVTSSIGLIEGTSTTDSNGVAYRTIRSTQAGLATINVTNLISVTGQYVITFTPGSPKRAIISASPQSLPANGVATSTLLISLLDNFGNPVGAGFTPIVQTSAGTMSGSGATDANGVVTRTLTAPLTPGTANFTVKYFGLPLSLSSDTVSFVVGPLDHVAVNPDGFLILIAGKPTTFTVQAYDEFNAPLSNNVDYGWILEFNGLGEGEQDVFEGPQMIFTGTAAGTGVKLTAWGLDGHSSYSETYVDIDVLPGPPIVGTLTIDPPTITANGVSPITFTLTGLADAYGNATADGEIVTVAIQSALVTRTNTGLVSGEEARVIMTATTQAGTYPISATSAAGLLALTGSTTVTFVPGPPAQAEVISVTPPAIVANNSSTSTVVLQLRDVFDNKVTGGLTSVVSATLGTILPDGAPTDSNGLLTRTLQSDLVVGEALLIVDGFAASGPTVSLIPGPPVVANVSVATSILTAGGDSTSVTFDVRDAWNHPVANGSLITPTLTPTYGSFSAAHQTSAGLVTQTLTPGLAVGTAIIGSTGLTVTGNTLINFVPGPAAFAQVTAWPTSLTVGGTTSVTVTVTDAYSNIVPPTPITTTAMLGTLDGGSSTVSKTTANGTGIITMTLLSTTAGTETLLLTGPSGPLTVKPTSDVIHFLPKEPLIVTLSPNGSITATAGVTLTVTASSRDLYGNVVDPWTPVDYTWWQNASFGSPGYGTLTAADPHTRSVSFKPVKIGPNRLWATGGVTTSDVLTVNVIAGPPATATMVISPASVLADGSSIYSITLAGITDSFGNAIPNGTPLTVTIQSSPPVVGVGTILNGEMAEVLPSSTNAGTYPVVVTGSRGPLTLNGNATMTFTPGPPVRASVDATPKTLSADGTSTANLVITVRDTHSNLVTDGMPITVTASTGTVIGSGATVNGKVMRTLRAPIALGTANFIIEGPHDPLFVSGDTVEFVPGAPAQALVIATPAKVLADGVSSSQITVTIKDGYGFTIPGNGTVVLSVTRGSLAPATAVASAGSFTSTFTAGNSVGLADLSVKYQGSPLPIVGDILELIPGSAVSATISANPTNLAVGTNEQSTLRVSLTDAWGRPVANGTAVTVTTSLGSILSNTSTTVGGVVTRTLAPDLTMGTAIFTVTTSANTLSPSGDRVAITPGNLHHIDILPTGTIQVTAGNPITFSAKVYDVFGNETGTGSFIWRLYTNTGYGNLSSTGVFTGTKVGIVGVQASQGTVYSSIQDVTVLPGSPITAVVSASPTTILVGEAASTLIITARDAFGNLVADGTILNVTTNLGSLTGSSTSRNGRISRTLTSGIYSGLVAIMVNGWEAGGDKVTFLPRSRLTADPSSLYADGVSETALTIEVFDASGAPVPDGTVPNISTSLGMLSGSGGTMGGKLIRTLRSSLTPGVAEIYVNGLVADGAIPFLIGPASVAHISANPPWLMADGTSQSALVITVQDDYGHVVTNAGSLTVTTNQGTMSGFVSTINGVTTRVLTAGTTSGAATIMVAELATAGDMKVHFVGESLLDGGFEVGGLDDWSVGRVATPTGSTPAYSASILSNDVVGNITVTPPSGSTMVRLGATTNDKTNHQLSEAWLSQPVYVSSGGLTQMTFQYRILSYDVAIGSPYNGYKEWDPFEVYLNGQQVLEDGISWSDEWVSWYQSFPTSPKDMGWKQGVLDLSPYAGQVVMLEFRLPNRQAPRDNTWVYLDSFSLSNRQTAVYNVFLPLVLR